ncbi:MAG: alpha/beta fold hydrolase [Chloroflexota bacterium]|nr:alpha/beta fold hydrolase [Chloroflexota bacterium]
MTEVMIDRARIHYRTYGSPRPGEPPVVLIHGSTIDGQTDWGHLAPLLARDRLVVVPDCRGHGRSTEGGETYSFTRLAADTAALIEALGYQRAHIVGHSNGGNVALVMLVEHPDVVATCVVQAGNAYVSSDLLELEPGKFDPDRVEREDPAWRDEMIRLHGPWHGPEYWRRLLRITVAEIVSEPRYAPDDLARADRPLLVIEGADDSVNATAGHAAFIADHVPAAELWRPDGVNHNVHHERPLEWIERVESFWERRGSPAADAIWRLREERFADQRGTVFELRLREEAGVAALEGTVLDHEGHRAASAALTGFVVEEHVTVLLDDARWALIAPWLSDIRAHPSSRAERLTQALGGEVVRTLDERDGWTRLRLQRDGYVGWAPTRALVPVSEVQAQEVEVTATLRVRADFAEAYRSPQGGLVGRLPFGTRLCALERQGGWSRVGLADGRGWWVRDDALSVAHTGTVDAAAIAGVLARFTRFIGVPYLWGGRTPYGFDCSGLSQALWESLGVIMPRDADQQHDAGEPFSGPTRAGDLLFFKASKTEEGITHVGIALDATHLLHASSAAGGTAVNSLDPRDELYDAALLDRFVAARRVTR